MASSSSSSLYDNPIYIKYNGKTVKCSNTVYYISIERVASRIEVTLRRKYGTGWDRGVYAHDDVKDYTEISERKAYFIANKILSMLEAADPGDISESGELIVKEK